MKFLAGLAASFANAFRRYVLPFLRALFGQFRWTPPPWFQHSTEYVHARGSQAAQWLNARRVASPLRFWIAATALLGLVIAGYGGWEWYKHLPEPHYLEVSVSQPRPTRFDPDQQNPPDEGNPSEETNPPPGISVAPSPANPANASSGGRFHFFHRHHLVSGQFGTGRSQPPPSSADSSGPEQRRSPCPRRHRKLRCPIR